MKTKPRALRSGDTIGIAAPSSHFSREAFEQGVDWLRAQGFRVKFRPDIFERHHYLAGSAERRLQELRELVTDVEVRALFFARGGYGFMQLLPHLDWKIWRDNPKIVLGYSDLTPMINLLPQQAGMVAFHGPLVAGLHKTDARTLQQMLNMLGETKQSPEPIGRENVQALVGGSAQGELCGGSLTLVASTLGTPFEIDTRGKILCLEEVGERPYRVDRLLQQLVLAGKLDHVAGIAIGEMTECEEPSGRGRPLVDIFESILGPLKKPMVCGLPFGHGAANEVLAMGAEAVLDAAHGTLQILAPVVRD